MKHLFLTLLAAGGMFAADAPKTETKPAAPAAPAPAAPQAPQITADDFVKYWQIKAEHYRKEAEKFEALYLAVTDPGDATDNAKADAFMKYAQEQAQAQRQAQSATKTPAATPAKK